MAREFSIWIVTPPGYSHSRCFEEVALSLHEAFKALGRNVPVVTDAGELRGTVIVLGGHLLPKLPPAAPLPTDLIIFNLEQIYLGSPWLEPHYVALLKQYPVWDYSRQNIAALAGIGVTAALCGVGYMPALTRIAPAQKDIDVLFIGSENARRFKVLSEIGASGVTLVAVFDFYGEKRDALIARAKIVLNMHFYDAKVFEIVRVSYLLANRACVVSETGQDPELEAPLAGGVAFAPYDGLAPACLGLLRDDAARESVAEKGFERMRALSQVDMLERALALVS
jgi:hypothetical protein